MKIQRYILWFLLLILALIACSQKSEEPSPTLPTEQPVENVLPPAADSPEITEEAAFFNDFDVDQATEELATTELSITATEIELPEGTEVDQSSQEELGTQTVLLNAIGWIVYIKRDPTAANLWKVYLHNQKSDRKRLVYKGQRAIDSVAVDASGDNFVLAMRQRANNTSDFEIYRYKRSTNNLTRITSNTIPDTNVSLSADNKIVVWEGEDNGRRAIKIRDYQNNNFTQKTLSRRGRNYIQPSVSGDGDFVAFIHKISASDRRVMLYDRNAVSNTQLNSTERVRSHPSPSDEGKEVAWLQNSSHIVLRDLQANTSTRVVRSGTKLGHPHIASDGNSLTYTKENANGNAEVYAKNLTTKQVVRTAGATGAVNNYAPFWQQHSGQVGVWGQHLWGQVVWAP